MANTKIVLNRQSDLILTEATIVKPVGIEEADIIGLIGHFDAVEKAADAEEKARIQGDAKLTEDLSSETSNRVAADLSLTSVISSENSTRVVAEQSLANYVSIESSARVADVDAEQERAEAAELSLDTDLSSEISRAIEAESSLNTKVEFVISNTDGAAIDSLTEIVTAFQTADGDMNNAITLLSGSASAATSTEASIRLAADDSIAANLSTELVDRAAAVSTEIVARISGDTSVALDLSSEVESRISADISAEAKHSVELSEEVELRTAADASEASIRLAADDSIAANLSTELVDRAAADASIAANLSTELVDRAAADASEASTRLAADDSIAANLSTELVDRAAADASEASTRLAADDSIAANLSTELVDRAAADAEIAANLSKLAQKSSFGDLSLEVAVSAEQARVDSILLASDADKDSFAEIVTLINSVDTTNDEAFASYVLSNNAALSTELVDRAAADASIASELSSEIANREAVVAKLESVNKEQDKALNEATISLEADLSSEISRAISVEAELDIKVTDIISNTDVSQIDSFVEMIDKVNEVTAANFDSIYAKKVGVTFDGVDTVTLATPVKPGSMMLFFNGLMVEANFDYTEKIVDLGGHGMVVGATLTAESAAFLLEGNVRLSAHGVYGEFSNISFIGSIDFSKLIAEAQKAVDDLQNQKANLEVTEAEAKAEYKDYEENATMTLVNFNYEITNLNQLIVDTEASKAAALAAGDEQKADEASDAIQKYQSSLNDFVSQKATLEMEFDETTSQRNVAEKEANEAIEAIDAQISTLTKEIAELEAQDAESKQS